jgi:antitoxin ParD1/3/4
MAEIQKVSVALTAEQVMALQQSVNAGEYATTSEAVRDALREWLWKRDRRAEDLRRLRGQWRAGKASGLAGKVDFSAARSEAGRRLKNAGHAG